MLRGKAQRRWAFGGAAGAFLLGVYLTGYLASSQGPDIGINLQAAWELHQIVVGASGTGQPDGADGVFLSDVDGDGLNDVATGHEQGLRLTLSFNPGPALVESPWPTVTLPNGVNLCSAEDVILGDLDGDGAKDIIAACETGTVRVSIFFAPSPPNTRTELLNAANWTQVDIAASAGNRSMRAAMANIDGVAGNEIIVGGKESSGPCVAAQVGYYANATPSNQASWASATFTAITPVGWVMQMYVQDLDGDTDVDIVYSDREPIDCPTPGGSNQGITVLKATSPGTFAAPVRYLGGEGDHKWFSLFDWDGDSDLDIAECRSNGSLNTSQILVNGGSFNSFPSSIPITQPANVGQCQHIVAKDIDNDGTADLAMTYSNSQNLSAIAWLRGGVSRGEISGILDVDSDVKMDNLAFDDVDGDGDTCDLLTTEQHVPAGTGPGLGVLYAECPLETFIAPAAPSDVACTLLTAGSSTSDGTIFQTASVTPGANRAIYVAVQSAVGTGPVAPTTTGNGLTYTQEETVAFSTRRLTVYRAMGASPSAGQITFTFGVAQTSAIWQVIECSNVDTTGTDASGATVQSVTATVAAGTTFTTTLAALQDGHSRHLCWVGLDISSTVNPDADLLELSDASVAAGASTLESQTALLELTCTPTFASSNGGGISIEVQGP